MNQKTDLSSMQSDSKINLTTENSSHSQQPSNKWKKLKENDENINPSEVQDSDKNENLNQLEELKHHSDNEGKIHTSSEEDEKEIETYTALKEKNRVLEEKLKEAEKKIQYSEAEKQNANRRHREEVTNIRLYAGLDTVKAFVGLLDSLEAANLERDEINLEQLKEGTQNILDLIHSIFKKLKVTEINPGVKEAFDPNIHSAVATEESESSNEPGDFIIKVLRKGYLLHERLIRPAMVIINQNKK